MGVGKLLLCCVLVLILQTHFSWVESKMVAPSLPIVVPVGSDVTLPCHVDSVRDLRDLVVEWARPDLKPPYVHIRRDGLDLLLDQNSLYQGRTRLTERGLQYGDMSLQLSRARLSDGGTYRCFVPQMDTAAEVILHVVSVSHVSVTLTKEPSGSPVLRCESKGWYPEPKLDWLDSEGKNLSRGRTEVISSKDETFSVSSRLSVGQSHGNSFTCRVRQPETRQSRKTDIIIKDEFLEVPSCPAPSCSVAWTLFTLCLLLIVAAVAFMMWKFKLPNRGKKSENKDTELGETEEKESMMKSDEDTSALKTQVSVQSSCLKSSEHKENLEKIQDNLEFVEKVINRLTETKDFLMKLKENHQEIINQLNSQIAVRKSKSHFWSRGKKEEHKEVIEDLERQKEQCMRTVEEIDRQVKTTEGMILEAIHRKGKLETEYKNEERRQEAAAGPEPHQGSNERKPKVPVATVQALNQTEEPAEKDREEQDFMEGLTNAMGDMSITNK